MIRHNNYFLLTAFKSVHSYLDWQDKSYGRRKIVRLQHTFAPCDKCLWYNFSVFSVISEEKLG